MLQFPQELGIFMDSKEVLRSSKKLSLDGIETECEIDYIKRYTG